MATFGEAHPVGSTLFLSEGGGIGSIPNVSEYEVTKVTPSGQVVAQRTYPNGHVAEVRVTPRGRIVNDSTWSRRRFVSAEGAAELRAKSKQRMAWRNVGEYAELVATAARNRDPEKLTEALKALAAAHSKLSAA